jgi:hypothetical protein
MKTRYSVVSEVDLKLGDGHYQVVDHENVRQKNSKASLHRAQKMIADSCFYGRISIIAMRNSRCIRQLEHYPSYHMFEAQITKCLLGILHVD